MSDPRDGWPDPATVHSAEYHCIADHVRGALEGLAADEALYACVSALDELMAWASHLMDLTLSAAPGEVDPVESVRAQKESPESGWEEVILPDH